MTVIAGYDVILSENSYLWDFLRVVHVGMAVVFFIGLIWHLIQRRHQRRWQGNALIAVFAAITINQALTAIARFGEEVSIRLPISVLCLAVGLVCLMEPRRRRDNRRAPWDLI